MKNPSRKHGFLGLSKEEERIVTLLSDERLSVAELSRRTGVARTTLDYMLPKLKNRGWVKIVRVGRRRLWTREAREMHMEQFQNAVQTFFTGQDTRTLQGLQSPWVRFHTGISALAEVYHRISSQPAKVRGPVCALQPLHVARESLAKFPTKQITKVNGAIVNRETVVHSLIPSNYYETLGREQGKQWLKSFDGRVAATSTLPEDYFTFDTDMWLWNDRVFLLNWGDETGLELAHPSVHALFQTFFNFMHGSGKKIDQNAHVRELLSKIQKSYKEKRAVIQARDDRVEENYAANGRAKC